MDFAMNEIFPFWPALLTAATANFLRDSLIPLDQVQTPQRGNCGRQTPTTPDPTLKMPHPNPDPVNTMKYHARDYAIRRGKEILQMGLRLLINWLWINPGGRGVF